jgi:hypothetical protein
MAFLWAAGYEWEIPSSPNGATPDGASGLSGTGTVTRDTSVFHDGVASLKIGSGAGNAAETVNLSVSWTANLHAGVGFTTSATNWVRFWFRVDALPSSSVGLITQIQNSSALCPTVVLTSTGTLQLRTQTSVQWGSDSAAITINTWHHLELAMTLNASNACTSATFWLDGQPVATGGPFTATGTNGWIGWVNAPGASKNINIDSLIVCDSTAGMKGPIGMYAGITPLFPISDNARVGWTTGASGTTSLFDDVNNQPPLGSATPSATNEIMDKTANTTDTYDANMTTITNAGVPANATILALSIFAGWAYSAASASVFGLQTTSNPVISEITGTGAASAVGTYPSFWNSINQTFDLNTLPALATLTRGNSMVMRVRKGTSSSTNTQYVCVMGAYVVWTIPNPSITFQSYESVKAQTLNAGVLSVNERIR